MTGEMALWIFPGFCFIFRARNCRAFLVMHQRIKPSNFINSIKNVAFLAGAWSQLGLVIQFQSGDEIVISDYVKKAKDVRV
jgi:hypothetical protein